MSAIEASSGTYRSRVDGTIVLSVEIEPRNAAAALALFGMPGTPMAIAALQVGYAAVGEPIIKSYPEKDNSEKPKGGPLARLAGIWCNDPEFINWINKTYVHGEPLRGAEGAADCIRSICDIDSRAELDSNEHAAELFHSMIRGPYSRHLIARGITV